MASIAFVCGQCHVREMELFRASPKAAGWEHHNEFLAAAPDGKCSTCHDDARAALQLKQFNGCVVCHSNHGINRPTVATFSNTGAFTEKRKEALQHAQAALTAGQHSLEELAYRRRGLFIALGVILAALVALALKLRQM